MFETYSGEVSSSGALWSGRLTYIPESQTGQDTLLTYDQLRSEPYQAGLQLFASAPLWTVCNDEYIAVLNPTDSVVTRLDTGGKAGSVKIPIALRPLTPDVVETWVDHRLELALSEENVEVDPATLAAIRQEALTEAMGAAAEVQPPTKILCDDEGRLWVQGFSVELDLQGYGREWAVFENEQLAASVTLPPRVWPLYLNREDIIAVWKDDFDVERLVQLENPMKAHR